MNILGCEYKVKYLPLRDDGGADVAGCENTGKQYIFIDRTVELQAQESTMLHEIIEAIDKHLDINLEHHTIMLLEAGLYQVLRENGINTSAFLKELK